MVKNMKQLCAGIAAAVVLSGAGVHFINKMLQEENNKKKAHETEQVVKDMSAQGISVFKEGREGAPDSILTSVKEYDNTWVGGKIYSDPQYKAKENEDSKTFKLGKRVKEFVADTETKETMRIVEEKIKELNEKGVPIGFGSVMDELQEIKKQRPMRASIEKETQYFEYEINGPYIRSDSNPLKHEQTTYDDGSKKVEFGYETYTFPSELPSDENMEQDKQLPKKTKTPKRTVSRDALAARVESAMEARRGRGKS